MCFHVFYYIFSVILVVLDPLIEIHSSIYMAEVTIEDSKEYPALFPPSPEFLK